MLLWEDEGDGPSGLPADVSADVRGQVESVQQCPTGAVRAQWSDVEVVLSAAGIRCESV